MVLWTFQWLYISVLYSNLHAPEMTYDHCEKACLPESTLIPFCSIFFFIIVDEASVSVNILYMNFSKVLYFPSSYCQLSLSHRLILFGGLLWASVGANPATFCSVELLIVSGTWNYIFTFFFFYPFLSICCQPDSIISWSAAFLFLKETFQDCFEKKKKKNL